MHHSNKRTYRVYQAETDVMEPNVLCGEYVVQYLLSDDYWRNVSNGFPTYDGAERYMQSLIDADNTTVLTDSKR